MRNIANSHEDRYLSTAPNPPPLSFGQYYGGAVCEPIMTSVWKAASGDVGVIFSAWLPTSGVPCPSPPACPCPTPPWSMSVTIPNIGDIGVANPSGVHSIYLHDAANPGGVLMHVFAGPSLPTTNLVFSGPGVVLFRIV